MEVRFTVTLDDSVAFTLHAVRKSGVGRGAFRLVWIGGTLLFVAGAVGVLQLNSEEAEALAFGLGLGAVAWAVVYPFIYRATIEHNARTYANNMGTRGIVGEITLILSEESLVEITEVGRSEARWENMHSVEEVGDYTYIFVTAGLASILPRHGFASDAEYEATRDFAMRKLVDERGETDRRS